MIATTIITDSMSVSSTSWIDPSMKTASSPVKAPVWLSASFFEVSLRPTFSTTTGTRCRSARSSAATKPAGSRTASRKRPITRVEGRESA